jgi:hypothetical protein
MGRPKKKNESGEYVSAYKRAQQAYERIQEERRQKTEQRRVEEERRKASEMEYLRNRKRMNKALKMRTRKGQPNFNAQIEVLVDKIKHASGKKNATSREERKTT